MTIDELIAHLTPAVTNLNTIVEKIDALVEVIEPGQLKSTADDMSAIVSNIRQLSEQIAEGRGLVGRLAYDQQLENQVSDVISDIGGIVKSTAPAARKLDPLVQDTQNLIGAINQNMQKIEALLVQTEARVREVAGVLQPAETLMNKSNRIADDVKVTSGVLSQEVRHLPDMINKMQNLLDSTNRTIQNAQQVWPLSTVIPPADSETGLPNQPLDD